MNKDMNKYVRNKIVESLQLVIHDVYFSHPVGEIKIVTPIFDLINDLQDCGEDSVEPMNTILLSVKYHLKNDKQEHEASLRLIGGDKYDIPAENGAIVHHTDNAKLQMYVEKGKDIVEELPLVYFAKEDILTICQSIGDWYVKYNDTNTKEFKKAGCKINVSQDLA